MPPMRPPLPVDALSANARIVDASFLESVVVSNATNNNDKQNHKKVHCGGGGSNKETVRRLAKIVQVLQTDDSIDPARTDEWPGLSSLANLLVSGSNSNSNHNSNSQQSQQLLFLSSPHKEVRLYSVLACLELLGIFAPDLPGHWTTHQLLTIFTQTLQQVSNLSHCYNATDRHFAQYTRILDLLAEVKIGIILVELVVDASSSSSNHPPPNHQITSKKKKNKHRIQDENIEDIDDDDDDDIDVDDDDDDDDENNNHEDDNDNAAFASTPLEVLAEFFQTLLGCVRREHPGQIRDQVVNALAACLEEFDCSARLDTTSIIMMDSASHHGINIPIRIIDEILLCLGAGPTVTVNVMTAAPAPPPPPPPKAASSNKKRRSKNKQAAPPPPPIPPPPPKAQLRTKLEPNPQYLVAAALLQKTANKTATPIAALLNTLLNSSDHSNLPSNENDVSRVSSIVAYPEMAFSDSHDDIWSIVAQVHRVAPAVLTTVIGTVGNALTSPEFHRRYASVRLLGQLFARKKMIMSSSSSSSSMVVEYRSIFTQWLGRQSDIDANVRKSIVSALLPILTEISSSSSGNNDNSDNNTSLQKAVRCFQQLVCTDPDVHVRLQGIQEICEYAHKKGSVSASSNNNNNISVWFSPLLKSVGSRLSAKNKNERKDAVTGLTRVYWKQYMMEHVLHDVSVIKTTEKSNDDDDDDEDRDHKNIVSPESLDVILRVLNEKCHLHKQHAAALLRPARHSSLLLLPTTTPASKKKMRQRRSRGNNDNGGDNDDDAGAADHDFFDERDADDAEESLYAWIPKSLFSAVSYSDQMDTDMRSRIVQLVDEVLLGSDQFQHKSLTPLARAVGLTVILHSLREDKEDNLLMGTATDVAPSTLSIGNNHSIRSAPFLWMLRLLEQRAALQKLLTEYMEARAKVREHKQGTEEAIAADARAMEILMGVAQLTAPVVGHGVSHQSQVLQAFHEARDKHIFRILATIAQANHSPAARARALEELPKRTHPLGDAVSAWVKNLVRRCAMGYFINAEIVQYSVLLARESFLENDIPACAALLVSAKTATTIFPALGGTEKTFQALTDLFSECRSATDPKIKKEVKEAGIITALSSILSLAARLPSANLRGVTANHDESSTNDNFQAQLFQLCTRDGTPEQARNAVYTLARTVSSSSSNVESGGGVSQLAHQHMLTDLLKALTCPTRLTLLRGGQDPAIISLFSALSAYSDCQPQAAGTDRMKKATRFALETILMGRGDDDDDAASDGEDEAQVEPRKKRAKSTASKQNHFSPNGSTSLLEDEDLSIACRRLCAAINFLVCHARASILHRRFNGSAKKDPFSCIPRDHAKQIFELLTQMLRDNGLPPSNRDRRLCKSRQDRAALRQCSAIHLFRLCDSRLGLENTLLSMKQWHQFSTALLDDEKVVRSAVMEEFSHFLKGSGAYGGTEASSPALRFVAFLSLCTDGDHGHDRDPANGFAANVGKSLAIVHSAALECVVKLREACDATYTKCRLMGPQAEKRFESTFKMLLMPEYMVPFSFHLLCHRRETITAVAPTALVDEELGSDEEDLNADDIDSKNRVVRNRLKTLFDPLVTSLGDSADNISFLLSMTALVRNYSAVDVSEGAMITDALPLDSSTGSGKASEPSICLSHRSKLLEGSIKLLSDTAREVLISLVKKDVNLSTYPGNIQMPASLFTLLKKKPKRKPATSPPRKVRSKRHGVASKTKGPQGMDIEVITSPKSGQTTPTPAIKTHTQKHRSSIKKHPMQEATSKRTPGSSPTTRVHFSPELQLPTRSKATVLGEDFGGVSPIGKFSPSAAPRQGRSRAFAASASVATLGTTPPSILPTGTQSTTQTDLTDTESVDSARPCDHIVESEVKLSLSSELGHSMSDGDEDHDGTPPEMLSSSVSRSSRTKKRKPDQPLDEKEDDEDEGGPRIGAVPDQIKFKDNRKKEDAAFAAESQSSSENQENSATKIGVSKKKKALQGTTRASEAKASGRRRLRPRRP